MFFLDLVLNRGGCVGPGVLNVFCNHFSVLKTSKNATKHMILSLKLKGDVISDRFLMLWFRKDSVDTVGFRTYGGGSRVLKQKVTF